MLTSVAVFLLLLIVLLVALLAIPVTLTFQLSWQQSFQGNLKLQWAFGLVRVRFPLSQLKAPSLEGKEMTQKNSRYQRSPRNKTNLFAVIGQQAFRRRIMKFISDFWRSVHKRNVSLRIRIGLGDPADTGQLWAIVGPVAGILSNANEASIEIIPEFFDTTIELHSSGSIRLIPLQMIYLTIGLLLSPPIWQGIKQMRAVDH